MEVPGQKNLSSREAIDKHRMIASKFLNLKFPSAKVNENLLKATSTLDLKFDKFDKNVVKVGTLPYLEV